MPAERPAAGPHGPAEGRRGPEAVELELFTHRFATIALEMGEMLQRTAVSTNVKERLDFSCALLDRAGGLVVIAPHIPVWDMSTRRDGTFSRSDFRWDKRRGVYICPNNKALHTRGTRARRADSSLSRF